MAFKQGELARVLETLLDEGVKFTVIGDTVVQLALGRETLEGDLDLFTYEPSPLLEAGFYRELAARHGWEASTTELGTVKLIVPLSEDYLNVELYENYMDIEIPEEILGKAEPVRVNSVEAPMIPVEAYLVLKARQGVGLDKLAEYVKQLRKTIDVRLVDELAAQYPEDEYETIVSRLRSIGLDI
ncbi:nucleotidyltransferase [Desulfurococcus mucosus]|uniref:Nucleotidyltransferase n=1 Tax=Desulfurococcus mucosus (strain ATCC 35584 / DSM 2162 / JCM 9187 / O7/1) TaxID=765177 RepID=E8R9Z7_DESM0|nr:nucleotidyltransferase [Desulfurococcus mucosus]ADV65323.1 Protein of unknown function DUF2204 [Desulfurococcus mucosus DSM 2162]